MNKASKAQAPTEDLTETTELTFKLPKGARQVIAEAADKDGKPLDDFLRIAALIAASHTRKKLPPTLFVDPRERLTLQRAIELGMTPVCEVGRDWQGEVRVPLNKNGLFRDRLGGLWGLTNNGLVQALSFEGDSPRAAKPARKAP